MEGGTKIGILALPYVKTVQCLGCKRRSMLEHLSKCLTKNTGFQELEIYKAHCLTVVELPSSLTP